MAKKSKTVNLSKYSKEDLIWIINYFVKWHGDFYIERAISELQYKKDIDRIHEAEKYSKTASLVFLNGVYYGTAAAPETIDSAFALGLTKILTDTRKRTVTVSAAPGEYIWYCFPESMQPATFKVGGFEGGFDLVATIEFTNACEHTEPYYIYRSANAGLGDTTVEVT